MGRSAKSKGIRVSGAYRQLAFAAVLGLGLAACTTEQDLDRDEPQPTTPKVGQIARPDHPLQCVPYARQRSGVSIYGDAYTWWDKAAGRFERNTAPKEGAVMVLWGYAGLNRAHVAVVRQLVNPRQIKVDHANWLDDGQIYLDDPVQDVSADNDWSQVRIWNIRASAWGSRTYTVKGFIGPGPDDGVPKSPVYGSRPVISMN
jgi:surface antigen